MAAGKKVELTIVDFEIEADGSTCPYDNLKAYDTPAGGSATLIAVRILVFFSLKISFLCFDGICPGHLWLYGQVWNVRALDWRGLGEFNQPCLWLIIKIVHNRWARVTLWLFTSPRTALSTTKASEQLGNRLTSKGLFSIKDGSIEKNDILGCILHIAQIQIAYIRWRKVPLTHPSANESDNIGQSPRGRESIWGLLLI